MLLLIFINIVLGYDYKSLKAQVNFDHLPQEYACVFKNSSDDIIATLAGCNSKSYENIARCIEVIGKTIEIYIFRTNSCPQSSSLVAGLVKVLEKETDCILFYTLKSYMENKDYLKSQNSLKKIGFDSEYLNYLRQTIIKDTDTINMCSYESKEIGVFLYGSIGNSVSTIKTSKILLEVSNHFYKDLKILYKDNKYDDKDSSKASNEDEDFFFYRFQKMMEYLKGIYNKNKDLYYCIIYKIISRLTERILVFFLGKFYAGVLKNILDFYMTIYNSGSWEIDFCNNYPEFHYIEEIFLTLLKYKKQLSTNLIFKLLTLAIIPNMTDFLQFIYESWVTIFKTKSYFSPTGILNDMYKKFKLSNCNNNTDTYYTDKIQEFYQAGYETTKDVSGKVIEGIKDIDCKG
jgi:hypothetical protein